MQEFLDNFDDYQTSKNPEFDVKFSAPTKKVVPEL